MVSIGVSLLYYAIAREIRKRFSSLIFERVRKLSILAFALSVVSVVLSLIKSNLGLSLEWSAYLVMLIGSIHLWGMTWLFWMNYAVPVLCVLVGGCGLIGGRITGMILLLMSGAAIMVYVYLKTKNLKRNYPLIAWIVFVVTVIVDALNPYSALRAWEGIAVTYALIERLIAYLHAIYHQSITDRLTGLYNRATFNNYVEDFLGSEHQVGVIFLDIDNFKQINDQYSHEKGDTLLKVVANILKQQVQGSGVASRYGGEELVALVIDQNIQVAAENIRQEIEQKAGLELGIGVTASIGVAKGHKGQSAEELVAAADDAMYVAKKGGKNRVVVADGVEE